MLGRILCALGFHRWRTHTRTRRAPITRCTRCSRVRVEFPRMPKWKAF